VPVHLQQRSTQQVLRRSHLQPHRLFEIKSFKPSIKHRSSSFSTRRFEGTAYHFNPTSSFCSRWIVTSNPEIESEDFVLFFFKRAFNRELYPHSLESIQILFCASFSRSLLQDSNLCVTNLARPVGPLYLSSLSPKSSSSLMAPKKDQAVSTNKKTTKNTTVATNSGSASTGPVTRSVGRSPGKYSTAIYPRRVKNVC